MTHDSAQLCAIKHFYHMPLLNFITEHRIFLCWMCDEIENFKFMFGWNIQTNYAQHVFGFVSFSCSFPFWSTTNERMNNCVYESGICKSNLIFRLVENFPFNFKWCNYISRIICCFWKLCDHFIIWIVINSFQIYFFRFFSSSSFRVVLFAAYVGEIWSELLIFI